MGLGMKIDLTKAKIRAKAFLRQGENEEAKAIFLDILEAFPENNFARGALQNLRGNSLSDHIEAMDSLHASGEFGAVVVKSKVFLKQCPPSAEALTALATAELSLNEFESAVIDFKLALELAPESILAHRGLALAYQQGGDVRAALHEWEAIIGLEPDNTEAYHELGAGFTASGELDRAKLCFERLLSLKEDDAVTMINLGEVLLRLKQLDASFGMFARAVKIAPQAAVAHFGIGNVLKAMDKLELAASAFELAITLKSDYLNAYANLGAVYGQLNMADQALGCLERVVKLNPESPYAHSNLGIVQRDNHQLEASAKSFDQAIKLKDDFFDARHYLSITLLTNGDFERGWQLYLNRFRTTDFPSPSFNSNKPKWRPGTPVRVLLWGEQGVGDVIMFSSMIAEFEHLCSEVTLFMETRTHSLLRRSLPASIKITDRIESHDNFDMHLPIGDLCHYLRPRRESFLSASAGYLSADHERSTSLRAQLAVYGAKRIIGLSWRTNATTSRRRNIDLLSVATPFDDGNTIFVNLQYGDVNKEIEEVEAKTGLLIVNFNEIDLFTDLDGLASLIQACDLVVSIDNVTVHLAGALGKDTRVLLPFSSDWRWQLEGGSSYWYDSLTLYRQGPDRKWGAPLKRLTRDVTMSD